MYLRFFKSELFRASKLKCTYILIIVLMALCMILNLVVLKFDFLGAYGMSSEQFMALTEGGNSIDNVNDAAQFGAIMGSSSVTNTESSGSILGQGLLYNSDIPTLFQVQVSGLNPLMLVAIFVGIFTGDILNTGITKNLVISNTKRNVLFAARATVIAIYVIVIHFFTWIFTIIGAAIWAKEVNLAVNAHSIGYWFLSLFLTIVFAILIYAITFLTRSKAAGITIGVVLSTGVLAMVISVANWLIIKKLDVESDFSVARYLLTENLGMLDVNFAKVELIRAIVVGMVYLAVAVGAVITINKKRDLA